MEREEAIECIRGFMGQLTEGCREAIMTAIPELAESEDERIRKALVEYFSQPEDIDTIQGVRIEKVRAWLEKRKEIRDPFDDEQFCRGYEAGKHDAEREQKPVEWSEEDEKVIELIESSTWDGEKLTQGEAGVVHRWLKDLPNRISLRPHWKPSEEQMESLIIAIHSVPSDENSLLSLYNDLKKL